jgi:nitrate/nitrite-specific signal transduction histidine kinase
VAHLSDFFNLEIAGEGYLAVVLPMSNMNSNKPVVALLMGSRGDKTRMLHMLVGILMFLGAMVSATFIIGIVLSSHFLKPVMEMEEGILKIINGDTVVRFDIRSSELGGLGYRINQMIDVLTQENDDSTH